MRTPCTFRYDEYDRALVRERAAQFRDQVERRIAGQLSEEEFLPLPLPLRLQNGLYLQKQLPFASRLLVYQPPSLELAIEMRSQCRLRTYQKIASKRSNAPAYHTKILHQRPVPVFLKKLTKVNESQRSLNPYTRSARANK
ncbi:hypothetical protein CUN61_23165 [Pseudomonas arsenicoxydans]|uniref:Uncharacterized protein n=1 Tax=Pseudomonas arsenicoxydans TaxID=702115 RepID=A0A4V0YKC6_9PSED|nr:hypothetical protein CUN61_23165 [Pseudomonas arsenicoxydans]